MNRSLSKRNILAAAIILVLASLAIYVETRPKPAAKLEALNDINNIETLRDQFNRDAGHTRLILLVSPT